MISGHLARVFPDDPVWRRLGRVFSIMWNYAWALADATRYRESGAEFDWEFDNEATFEALLAPNDGGAGRIILTAHMGNYDLGGHFFAEKTARRLTVVRAPEPDPATRRFVESHRHCDVGVEIVYSDAGKGTSFALLDRLRAGELVAIQGDRATPPLSSLPASLFGAPTRVPAGPFALARASGASLHPLFILRTGCRCYRVVAGEPLAVPPRGGAHRMEGL